MKQIISHKDGFALNDRITINAHDEDSNGVPHRFEFYRANDQNTDDGKEIWPDTLVGHIQFQKGPRNVEGSTPGLTTDAVLAMLIHVMQGFQDGPYKSREGAIMLTKLEEASLWSKKRAFDRAARGVLGYNAR